MSFKTEKEAEDIRLRKSIEQTEKFCPLIKDQCTSNCVCFYQGNIDQIKDEFYLSSPGCINGMFKR
jgi:hypothetical protein